MRLKAGIERSLADPVLKPQAAAELAGISVRYANELLASEGASLERLIQTRRLERCAEALSDPRQASRSISDIALGWGFSDHSHFGRRFRARFGLSPRDYRQSRLGQDLRRALNDLTPDVPGPSGTAGAGRR